MSRSCAFDSSVWLASFRSDRRAVALSMRVMVAPIWPRPATAWLNTESSLARLDSVFGQAVAGRGQIGATMTRIDNATARLSDLKLASQTELSNAQDLDMTQAISDFGNQQTGYDAALKAYSMVQRLSLFNYLSS